MKSIKDLAIAINVREFYEEQFEVKDEKKRILFVSPDLSSKGFYQMIVPYLSLLDHPDINCAITNGIRKYSSSIELNESILDIGTEEIKWATTIVFPFTVTDLTDVFSRIRSINPDCSICIWVDYNFTDLPDEHPHKKLFSNPETMNTTMMNLIQAQQVFCASKLLVKEIEANIHKKLVEDQDILNTNLIHCEAIVFHPYFFDSEVILQNIDFEVKKKNKADRLAESSIASAKKQGIDSVKFKTENLPSPVSEEAEEKEKDKSKKSDKKDVDKSSPKAGNKEVKEVKPETKKTSSKKATSNKKGYVKSKNQNPKLSNKKSVAKGAKSKKSAPAKRKYKHSKPAAVKVNNSEATFTDENKLPPNNNAAPTTFDKIEVKRIGIIYSEFYHADLLAYLPIFSAIKEQYKDAVEFVIVGIRTEVAEEISKKYKFQFEFVDPVSIIHYFKQLKSMAIDVVVIPLRFTRFNAISATTSKVLECGLLKIPVIAPQIGVYRTLITDKSNSILYNEKEPERTLSNTLHKTLMDVSKVQLSQMGKALGEYVSFFDHTLDNVEALQGNYN